MRLTSPYLKAGAADPRVEVFAQFKRDQAAQAVFVEGRKERRLELLAFGTRE